jgi:hypothetical protein
MTASFLAAFGFLTLLDCGDASPLSLSALGVTLFECGDPSPL